ncbi:serine hydrolase domain-containing protein [Armatimonas sp.]|uniref:serine hydrolase domain-containing protein n=1 Tax=Armatimonas sp. TaxID=1872638 RepID=UPI00374D6C99
MLASEPPEPTPARLPTRAELVRRPLPASVLNSVPVTGFPESLPELDGRLVQALQEAAIPGMALAIAQGGRLVAMRGYGTLTLGSPVAVEPTLPAMLCSLCKPLTAQAFLVLAQEDKLTLEDRADRWITIDPRITLRQLLTHRSGLAEKFLDTSHAATEAEHVKKALTEPLTFTPDERFLYSNVGYQVLGRILAAVTGQRPDLFIQKRLLDPLGIRSYFVATYLTPADRVRYDSGGAYVLTPHRYDKETRRHMPVRDRATSLAKEAFGSSDTSGAGCMSAVDFLHFLCSITPAQRQRIRKHASATGGYGLGWMLKDGGLAHTGIGSGETHYALTRESGVSYVCFLPSSNDEACERVLARVQNLVLRLKPAPELPWL